MLKFDKDEVRKILIEEEGLAEDVTERSIELLLELDEGLQPLLDQWLKDRSISDHKINGVSLEMMYKYFEARDFIGALIYIGMFTGDEGKGMAETFLEDPYLLVGRR
ncbi:hypothetical protein [Hazenella coriacea]|uniref:Uncharacterized protein n=1 Tax=Hazenella coriacea TaxID=1179467 RepID=A0A4R3L6V3_9BACL|nr:hypothetical protein [Hazenella coriacea]TCS94818.1 hypothetical protein EDD58_103240 [Hazenella coriacea]